VTDEQIYGFGAIFATNHAKSLCPVCKEVVEVIRQQVTQLDESLPVRRFKEFKRG
jgi:hypothetical protein